MDNKGVHRPKVLWEYIVQGVRRPIAILGVHRPGSTSSKALGVHRLNKWEYIGQGVHRLVILERRG